MPLIEADDRQNGKWDISFSIEAGKKVLKKFKLCVWTFAFSDEETNVQDIFYISNADIFGQSKGRLQLKATPDVNGQYTVRAPV